MSVLVRGMEMPKTCGKCQIKNAIECTRWKLVRSVVLDRHKNCPLVPVPPHGRLIDADSFLSLINDSTILSDFLKCIINPLIRGEPTVIEAEEGREA